MVFAGVAAAHRYHTGVVPSDFEVFWRAGGRFLSGQPLYPQGPIDQAFLYPPFAALVFQLLAILPLPLAAALASFGNTLLYVAAVWLTWDLVRSLHPAPQRVWPWLGAGALLSLRYFQSNAAWIQTNLLVFLLVLAGIAAGRRERWVWAAALLAAAAGIKVVPAIFVVWLLLRGPIRATAPAVAGAVAVAVLIPLLWRGPAQGWIDLTEFVQGVLSGYATGAVRIRWDNYNLATLTYGLFVPLDDPAGTLRPLLPGGAAAGGWLYRILALGVVGSWLGTAVWLRRRRAPWSSAEVTATLLAALLLSGVTWLHHLVPLLFVVTTLLVYRGHLSRWLRWSVWLTLALAVVAGAGRDLVEPAIYDAVRALRLLPLLLVLCFVTSLALTFSHRAGRGS